MVPERPRNGLLAAILFMRIRWSKLKISLGNRVYGFSTPELCL